MEQMQEVLIVGIIFFSIVAAIRIISESRLRHRMIDKGLSDENVKAVLRPVSAGSVLSSVKWGLLLIGIGLALLLVELLPRVFDDTGAFGLMFLFAGIALFAHYFLASREQKKSNEPV